MRSVSAKAPGKCILFGEHSVVYGNPAIAMAINLYSTCTVEEIKTEKIEIILDNFEQKYEFSNYRDLIINFYENRPQFGYCIEKLHDNFNINFENTKISIFSSLIKGAGLGSSASTAVAFVAAINEYYQLRMEKNQISALTLEMEKKIHGTPSGIDNTTCTFGKMIYFKKGNYKVIDFPVDFKILITYTNMEHNTKRAIEKIGLYKKQYPKLCKEIFNSIKKITKDAKKNLKTGNLQKIGLLMNQNQELLTKLGLSNQIISDIISISLQDGALGNKLTGAGLGGCVISLGYQDTLLKISKSLSAKGFKNFIVGLDYEGVKIGE